MISVVRRAGSMVLIIYNIIIIISVGSNSNSKSKSKIQKMAGWRWRDVWHGDAGNFFPPLFSPHYRQIIFFPPYYFVTSSRHDHLSTCNYLTLSFPSTTFLGHKTHTMAPSADGAPPYPSPYLMNYWTDCHQTQGDHSQ